MRTLSSERLAALHEAYTEGLSRQAIGRRLGITKSAACGLVRRYIFGKANGYRNPEKADKPRKVYSRKKKPAAVAPPDPPPPKPPPPFPEPAATFATCQWPLTNGRPWRFCNAPVCEPGSAWCREHHAIVYVRRTREWAA